MRPARSMSCMDRLSHICATLSTSSVPAMAKNTASSCPNVPTSRIAMALKKGAFQAFSATCAAAVSTITARTADDSPITLRRSGEPASPAISVASWARKRSGGAAPEAPPSGAAGSAAVITHLQRPAWLWPARPAL